MAHYPRVGPNPNVVAREEGVVVRLREPALVSRAFESVELVRNNLQFDSEMSSRGIGGSGHGYSRRGEALKVNKLTFSIRASDSSWHPELHGRPQSPGRRA